MIKSTKAIRIKRTLTALLLVFVLSFTAVFAETEPQAENTGDAVQTEAASEAVTGTDETGAAEAGSAAEVSEPAEQDQGETAAEADESAEGPEDPAPAPRPKARIIRKGKYYYYMYASGKIRRKAGFVTVDGKRYYVRKGGRIITGRTFIVDKKYYRANRSGIIKTGVYRWNGNRYYSSKSGVVRRREGFVTWKGDRYYVKKGGKIIVSDGFCSENTAYAADSRGRVTRLEVSEKDDCPVMEVARAQVGIMTGKTYWRWYYKTKFVDTDRTPWCGAFVAWCYNEAGLYEKITTAKKYGPLGYVPSYSRYADKYKKWVKTSRAKGGDIIVFGRDWHVGLVEGLAGDYIITIEGNAGPTAIFGSRKPGAVIRNVYKISSPKIKGVIRP